MNKWAIANGSWSNSAIWNDGILPTEGDIVYANGHTVNFNNEINIGNGWLRNDAYPELGIVAGGLFSSTSGGNTEVVTANVYGCNDVVCLYLGTNGTKTVNGNLSSDDTGAVVRYDSASNSISTCGILNINGNLDGRIDNDTTLDAALCVININGNWKVKTNMYAYKAVRTNWYATSGTYITIAGEFDFTGIWASKVNTVYYLSVGDKLTLRTILNLPNGAAGSTLSLHSLTIDIFNLGRITGWSIAPVFDAVNSYIINSAGEILMIGVNIINYPEESDVKGGVKYGYDLIGTYSPITETELNRIRNCATISSMQKLFEDMK